MRTKQEETGTTFKSDLLMQHYGSAEQEIKPSRPEGQECQQVVQKTDILILETNSCDLEMTLPHSEVYPVFDILGPDLWAE